MLINQYRMATGEGSSSGPAGIGMLLYNVLMQPGHSQVTVTVHLGQLMAASSSLLLIQHLHHHGVIGSETSWCSQGSQGVMAAAVVV
jgi:hypothetical protein